MNDLHQDKQDAAIRLLATYIAHVAGHAGFSGAKRLADEVDEILCGAPGALIPIEAAMVADDAVPAAAPEKTTIEE